MKNKRAYQGLRDRLLHDLWSGDDVRIGLKLPTERALEKRYKVSRTVVRESLATLAADGWIRKVQGSGIYIAALTTPLKTEHSRQPLRIGCVVQNLRSTIAHRVVEGVEALAMENNCRLEIASSNWDYSKEKKQIQKMRDDGVAGVVLYPTTFRSEQKEYLACEFRDFPIVVVDLYQNAMKRPHLLFDNCNAGREMTQYLLNQGRRNIAFLKYDNVIQYRSVDDRIKGYCRALKDAGLTFNHDLIIPFDGKGPTTAEHIAALEKILAMNPRPDALITPYDPYAEASIDYLRAHNVSVPDDMIVAGFDNLQDRPWADHFPTTRPDFMNMGERAAEMLLERIESRNTVATGVILPCPLAIPPRIAFSENDRTEVAQAVAL